MPIDMSLLKDFCCVLTVPKGGLVRQLQEDGSWLVVRSPERLQILYRSSAADVVSAEAGMLTCKVLAASASKGIPDEQSRFSRMMFAGRAAGTKANILFDTSASANFVSKKFAKQTDIMVRPVEYYVRLADDKTMEVAGEATVYVQLGSFHKPVKCYVMDMLYEVDFVLGEAFMLKYNCILHYGKRCIMIQKGKRHVTMNSPALPRIQPPVEEEKSDSVLSASQLKRMARKGARVFLAVIRPVEFDLCCLWWPLSQLCLSQPRLSNLSNRSVPQAVRYRGFPSCCLSFLKCFRILCRLVCPLNVQKGTVFLQSQVILLRFQWSMYRLSPLEYQELEKQVTKFLKDGILEVSQSPYGAPVLFVPKPNGRGLRLCVDYRALYSITVKNRCTIPRIDDLLDAVAGSEYFTSLDLTSGYHQILISEEDRPKTALRTPFGHFQF
jgi:hypothetical protein